MRVIHNLEPVYNNNSYILILGSMPSVISRNKGFYYAHPSNRFWTILEKLFNVKLSSIVEKKKFLLDNRIALWDTIKRCDINNSADYTITNVEVNDIKGLIERSNIKHIFCTGSKAFAIYNKYIYKKVMIRAIPLLSPSSANAKYNLPKLVENYKIIKEYLDL